MSMTVAMTEDANREIAKLLLDKNYYVGVSGRANFSGSNDVTDLVLSELAA